MSKILILGGQSRLATSFLKKRESGVNFTFASRNPSAGDIFFDADKLDENLFNFEAYDYAILLFGITDPETCWRNPKKSNQVNVKATKKLLAILRESNVFPVFLSSEMVYSKETSFHTEGEIVQPQTIYGCQKVEIENFITKYFEEYLILRTAKMYSTYLRDGSLFHSWSQLFGKCERVFVACDQFFSPIEYNNVVEVILYLLQGRISGVFNLGSGERWSRMELMNLFVETVKFSTNHKLELEGRSLNTFGLAETRTLDLSMSSTKLESVVNYRFRKVQDDVRLAVKNYLSLNDE